MTNESNAGVKAAEEARCAGLIAGDRAALERLYTDDFVYVHSSGRVEQRASYVSSVTSGENPFRSFNHSDLRIDVLGDVALMTGTVEMQRSKGTVVFLFVEVWLRQDGGWRLKYQQNTKKADHN